MNLERLLSTVERIRILKEVIYKEGEIRVNTISRKLRLSKGLVSKFLHILVKERLMKRSNKGFIVRKGPRVTIIRILFNLDGLEPSIFKKFKFVRGAGVYGSYVKGTNTEGSDMDIYILVDKAGPAELASLTQRLREKYGNISPIYLTKEKVERIKKDDRVFYHSLVFGSFHLYGDDIAEI
jgi:predicted nucleotidyltransferase